MEKNMKAIKLFSNALLVILCFYPISLKADTWIDEDGDSAVQIRDKFLTIYSLGGWYYFDELFSDVRQGSLLRLCLGFEPGPGMATDCLGKFEVTPSVHNEGYNRSLSFNIEVFSFIIDDFENSLRSGKTLKLSIDNDDLFAAYTLNVEYKFNEDALEILAREH